MWAKHKRQYGFTIVELLIVIVVIAVLATISIIAYNGIRQRATTASVNSAIDQWVKLIRAEAIKSSYSIPDGTGSCLGRDISDFPQENGFNSGVCVTLDGATQISYNSAAFSSWSTSQPRINGKLPITELSLGGSKYRARGIWIHSSNLAAREVNLAWIPQISDQCAKGTSIVSNGVGSLDGGYCVYGFTY